MSFVIREALRGATGDTHEALDILFGRYDIAAPGDYRRFLSAHARALLPVEAALATPPWPAWRPRASLMRADLAALGLPVPPPLPVSLPAGPAAAWGALYVVEGSRLGGTVLAARVGAGLPRAYLADRHATGEWRAFLSALDAAAEDEAWVATAVAGAKTVFAAFAEAAALESPTR